MSDQEDKHATCFAYASFAEVRQEKGRREVMYNIVMMLTAAVLLAASSGCGYKERQAAQQAQVEAQQAELERQKREIQKLKQQPQF